MARKFGMIGSTIWDSDKFAGLSDDSARLTYLCLCTTHHGNSVGVYKMPAAYLAVDRRQTRKQIDDQLNELEESGLIDRGPEDQVRVTRWFYGPSGANSPSTGSSYAKTFMDPAQVRRGHLRMRAVMEMLYSTLEKSRGWNPETKQLAQMQEDFSKLLRSVLREDHEEAINACIYLGFYPSDMVWDMVWDMVLPTIPPTVRTYIQRHWTPEMEKEKDTERDTEKDMDMENGNARAGKVDPASPPTASPADGSRTGGKRVPEDIQQAIKGLGMCQPCGTKKGYGDCPECKKIKSKK